ncbi:DUF4230 domain-containing protein [Romboutsia sp.]|uniref:DUF4230 domain-containing protein n=1 Tax=Romboutsia sp. TaxID=1965302 RepID=UPI003F2D72EA
MLQKQKKIKKVHILLPIFILMITSGYLIYKYNINKKIYMEDTRVLNTISQVLDLNTVRYNYSNIVTIKKDKSINNIKIPFTEKSFIIKYNGVINGGITSKDIKIINNNGKEITIEIKNCRILQHYIDDKNIYVYDVKSSIFNKLDIQEVLNDINKYKSEYEEKLIKEGFLNEVQKKTKMSLENMLLNMGYKKATIIYK